MFESCFRRSSSCCFDECFVLNGSIALFRFLCDDHTSNIRRVDVERSTTHHSVPHEKKESLETIEVDEIKDKRGFRRGFREFPRPVAAQDRHDLTATRKPTPAKENASRDTNMNEIKIQSRVKQHQQS